LPNLPKLVHGQGINEFIAWIDQDGYPVESDRKLDEFAVRRTNGTAVVILEPDQAIA